MEIKSNLYSQDNESKLKIIINVVSNWKSLESVYRQRQLTYLET